MEIRIKISSQEFEDLKARSDAVGSPSVNAYCRSQLFPEQNYSEKWAQVLKYILSLEGGKTFYIRDALPNPPALFGRWAYEQRKSLGIELDGKDRTGTNRWRKLFRLED